MRHELPSLLLATPVLSAALAAALAAALPAVLTDRATAQELIYRLPDGVPGTDSLAIAIGDFDRDGRGDFAVHGHLPIPNGPNPSLCVLSGRDGTVLATLREGAFAMADLDGDGRFEVIHSQSVYSAGPVDVRTTEGTVLYQVPVPAGSGTFGALVRVVGDWDRDGVRDFCVAAPGDDRRGRVYAFSGADGAPLCDFGAAQPVSLFGFDLQPIADVDGDRIDDLVVGQHGSAGIYAGGTGRHVRELGAGQPQDDYRSWYGVALDVVGDVDGDQVADVVVGCEFGDFARLCSGRTGAVLHTLRGRHPDDRFGVDVAGVGDADGDGLPDVAVGGFERTLAGWPVGYVAVHSSRTGGAVFRVPGPASGALFGRTVSACGDVDGDGQADFAVGNRSSDPLVVLSVRPLPLRSDRHLVTATAGGVQSLLLAAGAEHAGSIYLVLGSASGIAPGFELGIAHVPLNADGWLALSAAQANRLPFAGTLGVLDAAGRAGAGLVVPPLPAALAGLRLDHAFVVAPIGGPVQMASNAVPLTLQ